MEKHELYNGEEVMHYDDGPHKYWWTSNDNQDLPTSTQITGILDKPGLRYWYVNKALEHVEQGIKPGRSYDEIQLGKIFKKAKYGGADARDDSADVGKLVHKWCEQHIKALMLGSKHAPEMPKHTGVVRCIENFLNWEFQVKPEYVFSERRMISRKHEFAGTMDIGAYVDPFHLGLAKKQSTEDVVPTVVDIKTGKNIYPESWLQLASYGLMLWEEQVDGFKEELEDIQRLIIHIPQATGGIKTPVAKSDITEDAATFIHMREVYRWKEGR
jgi:hypothetical protein